MATPTKVTAITLENAQLTSPGLTMANLNKADLINWLNSTVQPDVAVYFETEGDDVRLVMAPASSSGISANNHYPAAPLPCPPYCKPR